MPPAWWNQKMSTGEVTVLMLTVAVMIESAYRPLYRPPLWLPLCMESSSAAAR